MLAIADFGIIKQFCPGCRLFFLFSAHAQSLSTCFSISSLYDIQISLRLMRAHELCSFYQPHTEWYRLWKLRYMTTRSQFNLIMGHPFISTRFFVCVCVCVPSLISRRRFKCFRWVLCSTFVKMMKNLFYCYQQILVADGNVKASVRSIFRLTYLWVALMMITWLCTFFSFFLFSGRCEPN